MAQKMTLEQILSKATGTGKVTLQIEQEIWNEGEKLSKPHDIVVYPKYLQNEVTNLIALGYTVEFVSQEILPMTEKIRKDKDEAKEEIAKYFPKEEGITEKRKR